MGRNQKQIEQIRMAMNKIKFIERSLKYDIRAKLRLQNSHWKCNLKVTLNSTPVSPAMERDLILNTLCVYLIHFNQKNSNLKVQF